MIRSVILDSGARELNAKFTDISTWPSIVFMYFWIQYKIIVDYFR